MKFRIPSLMLAGLMAAQTLTACGSSAASTETTAAPVTTEAPTTTANTSSDDKKGGCGSSVALLSVIGIAAIGCVTALKRKKED